jgi:Zn-dependent protease
MSIRSKLGYNTNMILTLVYLLVAMLLAIVLHEFSHAWAGHMLGDRTAHDHGRLSLNPLVHIDPLTTILLPIMLILAHSPVLFGAARPVPFNPLGVRYGKWGVVIVALAGPLTNILLAIFFALWLQTGLVPSYGFELFIRIITTNVAFGLFNLIPFPPLDGSRLLYAVVPMPVREVMDRIERAGIAAVFVLLFLLGPIFLPYLNLATGYIVQVLVPGLTSL